MIIIPKNVSCLLSCEIIKCAQREDSLSLMIIIPKDVSCLLSCEVIKCALREDSLSPMIIIPKDVHVMSIVLWSYKVCSERRFLITHDHHPKGHMSIVLWSYKVCPERRFLITYDHHPKGHIMSIILWSYKVCSERRFLITQDHHPKGCIMSIISWSFTYVFITAHSVLHFNSKWHAQTNVFTCSLFETKFYHMISVSSVDNARLTYYLNIMHRSM